MVRSVTAASMQAGSMVSVSASTSANTGVAPSHTTLDVVATYENGVVITSPRTPSALIASCSATVPFPRNQQCRTPR